MKLTPANATLLEMTQMWANEVEQRKSWERFFGKMVEARNAIRDERDEVALALVDLADVVEKTCRSSDGYMESRLAKSLGDARRLLERLGFGICDEACPVCNGTHPDRSRLKRP